jgi:hypothetical protein
MACSNGVLEKKQEPDDTGCFCCVDPGTYESTYEHEVDATAFATYLDDDGLLDVAGCASLCADMHWDPSGVVEVYDCEDLGETGTEGAHTVSCHIEEQAYCEGRAHESLAERGSGSAPSASGAWLARAACAEAGAVHAFLALRRELAVHGGGGWSAGPTVQPTPVRSLVEIAIENAVEGCVNETFAALVAGWQSQHADAADVRVVMARIAADEAGHAQLAYDLHAWLETVLTDAERAQVTAAWSTAARAVADSESVADEAVRQELGLPDREQRAALASELGLRLWRPAEA